MENYYAVLGLNSSATIDEIRRAYRILARRYHPDVNPGAASEEKFKKVAQAYGVLSEPDKRKQYDLELERAEVERSTRGRAFTEYARAAQHARARQSAKPGPRPRPMSSPRPEFSKDQFRTNSGKESKIRKAFSRVSQSGFVAAARRVRNAFKSGIEIDGEKRPFRSRQVSQISIIEVSISVADAIRGVRKTVEINEGSFVRKISVTIPAGVRNGSVVRFRQKGSGAEEIVVITRVAAHPFISMTAKGVVLEVPVTISEALNGAKVQVPGIDEPVIISIEPGSQSGTEIRLRDRGAQHRDGTRGDLFVRLMIRNPASPEAVGLKEKVREIEAYYGEAVRRTLPKSLLDL